MTSWLVGLKKEHLAYLLFLASLPQVPALGRETKIDNTGNSQEMKFAEGIGSSRNKNTKGSLWFCLKRLSLFTRKPCILIVIHELRELGRLFNLRNDTWTPVHLLDLFTLLLPTNKSNSYQINQHLSARSRSIISWHK